MNSRFKIENSKVEPEKTDYRRKQKENIES